jgi:hypothetical protein
VQRYYSNLLVLEDVPKESVFCRGRGWQISFEPNPSSNVTSGGEPAKEIVIHTQTEGRAQYVADLILAAHCLYTGDILTFDRQPVFPARAQTIQEIKEQLMAGGGRAIAVYNLSVSCLIAAKASRRNAYQYAVFKYLLSCRTMPLGPRSLDPQGDWESGKVISAFPEEHVFNANAITLAYSVLEELSFDMRASSGVPSRIDGQWNPVVKEDLKERLVNAGINISEPILWHLRETPTRIERVRKPPTLGKCEWAGYKVRDKYLDIIEAIAYASWLRSKISAHRASALTRSLTICDVANVQHLSRRLLLEALGFW